MVSAPIYGTPIYRALDYWRRWKDVILHAAEAHQAPIRAKIEAEAIANATEAQAVKPERRRRTTKNKTA